MAERPAFLDNVNAGLLSGVVGLLLLTAVGWLGPLRGTLANLEQERLQHVSEYKEVEKRAGMMRQLGRRERLRLGEEFAALRARTVLLGVNPGPELVREVSGLIEAVGVHDTQLFLDRGTGAQGMGTSHEPLEVRSLDGEEGFLLVPHPVVVRARAGFSALRRALDRLTDPSVPVQLDHVTLVRDGLKIRADIGIVYWTRTEPS